jgi:type IV pilus assembly protein PilB
MEPHTIPQAEGQFHDLTVGDPSHAGARSAPAPAGVRTAGDVHVPGVGDPFAAQAAVDPAAQAYAAPAAPVAPPGYEDPYAAAADPGYAAVAPAHDPYADPYAAAADPGYAAEPAAPADPYAAAADPYAAAADPGYAAEPAAPAEYLGQAPAAPAAESHSPLEPAPADHGLAGEGTPEEPPAHDPTIGADGELLLDGLSSPSGVARHCRTDLDAAIALGLLTPEQVAAAQALSAEQGRLADAILLEQGAISPENMARAVSERHGIELIDLSLFKLDFTAANLIDPAAAKRYEALPVKMITERVVMVAMVDPANIIVIDDISLMTGLDVRPVVASREDVATAISRLTRLDDVVSGDGVDELEDDDSGVVDLRGGVDDAPVIKLVNQVIAQAVERGASDIHLQAGEFGMRVRYRVDGVLVDAADVPKKMAAGLVSRVKIMATLDIAERRIPQDGRISLSIDGHKLDLRVVTLPSVHGEAVIMRILDKSSVVMDLDILGMRQEERERFETGFHQAYGAVLVTGPTGSGKSTTLYAALGAINTPEKNIITIEDPVEYQLAGVNQVQVNPKAGLSFATGLRALMRADPDVIMVGEIRDKETAQIAIESALTGHLVLSTLHTNDAPSAVSRLMEMGIEPFLIASSVETVVAQRLARKLCKHCKAETELSVEVLKVNGFDLDQPLKAFEAKGCSRCGHSGYKGRLGLYEVMSANDDIREMITARATADEIGAAARKTGMRTLRDDGIAKVESGLTSIQEVARVCGTT